MERYDSGHTAYSKIDLDSILVRTPCSHYLRIGSRPILSRWVPEVVLARSISPESILVCNVDRKTKPDLILSGFATTFGSVRSKFDSCVDAHFLEVGSRIDLTLRSVDARKSRTELGKIDLAKFELGVDRASVGRVHGNKEFC